MIQARRDKPLSGQSGPPLHLTLEQLNKDERKLYDTIWAADHPLTLDELSRTAFRLKPNAAKASSRVRNGLRRLVRSRGVSKPDRGTYGKGSSLASAKVNGAAGRRSEAQQTREKRMPRVGAGSSKVAAEPENTAPALERFERRVEELQAGQPPELVRHDDNAHKFAIILAAAEELGPKATAIAKSTGYSRGLVIRRLKAAQDPASCDSVAGFLGA
jgi:hypothetical protein